MKLGDIMKKWIAICIFLIFAVSSLSFVCAEQSTTIGGHNFKIPDGFKENSMFTAVNEPDETGDVLNSVKAFEKGGDVIYICVGHFINQNLTSQNVSSIGNEAKTINGVEGYTFDDGYVKGYNNIHGFIYESKGDLIIVLTTDESLFDQVVGK